MGGREVVHNVRPADAYCRCYLRNKREDTEVVLQSQHVVHVDKRKVCPGETPKSWLPVDMDDNTDTASEDEPEDGEIQDD